MPPERSLDGPSLDTDRSRRQLLKEFLGGGLSVGAIASLAGCPEDLERTDTSGNIPVRRSIASLLRSDPDGIIPTFKDAVRQMRNLPSSDPRSWDSQVAIHGQLGSFNECEHGNWLFLPWHRAYLFYFEEICRDLTGNADFALPFWNWSDNRGIPAIFGQSHNTPTPSGTNPLYNPTRNPGRTPGGATMSASVLGPTTLENDVLSDPNFLRAVGGGWNFATGSPSTQKGDGGGQLEQMHNYVHGWVGGDMGRGNSPNDPIFWTHHCFVDCVWWEWNARRGHPNTSDSDWLQGHEVGGTHTPTPPTPTPSLVGDFVDEAKNVITDVSPFATLLMPLLSYRYENVGKGGATTPTPEPAAGTVEDTDELRSFLQEGADVDLRLAERYPIREELQVRVGEPISVESNVPLGEVRPFTTGEDPGQLLLTARNILPPSRPDFVTRVFVKQPRAVEQYSLEDPHFAGTISFFEPGSHHPNQSRFVYVTDTLATLDRQGTIDEREPLSFQLVPEPIVAETAEGQPVEGEYVVGSLALDATVSVIDGEVVEKEPQR